MSYRDSLNDQLSRLTSRYLTEDIDVVSKKSLNEGASNFWSMEQLPLLMFGSYEEQEDDCFSQAVDELTKEFGEDGFDTDQAEQRAEEIVDKEYDFCLLSEDEIDSLRDDIDSFVESFNKSTDPYDEEDIEIEIKNGYYQHYQLYCDDDWLTDRQVKGVKGFFEDMKHKYALTELGVSYRFSNGETGYRKVESLKTLSRKRR